MEELIRAGDFNLQEKDWFIHTGGAIMRKGVCNISYVMVRILLPAVFVFGSILLCTQVQAKTSLVRLKNNRTYRYDVNADGRKEKIRIRKGRERDDDWSRNGSRYVYINGKLKIRADGYDHAELYVFTNNKKGILIHSYVGGPGSNTLSYYYYKKGKYKEKSLTVGSYYWETPKISKDRLKILYDVKGSWWMESFKDQNDETSELPFP